MTSRHGVIEEVATMIRTKASEKTVSDYVDNLLRKHKKLQLEYMTFLLE